MKQELIKKFKNEKLINQLLSYRNSAAHANVYGELNEISDKEIRDMIEKFKKTMNYFIELGYLIKNIY